jgi:hypothetical protein
MQRNVDPHAGELLDEATAAQRLSVAPATLRVWRCTGRYALPFVKVGRLVRYRAADLDHFLQSRTRQADEQAEAPAPLARVIKAGADAWKPPAKPEALHDQHVKDWRKAKRAAKGAK